jgi:hypothetical protein
MDESKSGERYVPDFDTSGEWRWRARLPDGTVRVTEHFEQTWLLALGAQAAGTTPYIDYRGDDGVWVELHQLIIPIQYIGGDDPSSRVRRLVEQKIIFGALREHLGLGMFANIDVYL